MTTFKGIGSFFLEIDNWFATPLLYGKPCPDRDKYHFEKNSKCNKTTQSRRDRQ
jgi:hypothetical protein